MIKKLRKQHHYSQEQLATLAGVSLRTIQRIESGHSASLETLKSLAAVFEIEIELLTGEIGVIDKNTEEWASAPLWVRFGFWGIRDRKVAFRFEILSLTLGSIGILAGFASLLALKTQRFVNSCFLLSTAQGVCSIVWSS